MSCHPSVLCQGDAMNTLVPDPSKLRLRLYQARNKDASVRRSAIEQTLFSGNWHFIHKIPVLLNGLSQDETDYIVQWANEKADQEDCTVTIKSSAFHLMVRCKVPSAIILDFLIKHRLGTKSVLDEMPKILTPEDYARYDTYIVSLVSELIERRQIAAQERGWRLFMSVARTPEDWRVVAEEMVNRLFRIRPIIIKLFFSLCKDVPAREKVSEHLIRANLRKIHTAHSKGRGGQAVECEMHRIIDCAEIVDWQWNLPKAVSAFFDDFGDTVRKSVLYRLLEIKSKLPPDKQAEFTF